MTRLLSCLPVLYAQLLLLLLPAVLCLGGCVYSVPTSRTVSKQHSGVNALWMLPCIDMMKRKAGARQLTETGEKARPRISLGRQVGRDGGALEIMVLGGGKKACSVAHHFRADSSCCLTEKAGRAQPHFRVFDSQEGIGSGSRVQVPRMRRHQRQRQRLGRWWAVGRKFPCAREIIARRDSRS
ncbi:hypothetical protein B0T17DRAFT_502674 [Bombardia bombarda]|uniref:Secreted protein n=1 Tax=Bombardia bombarda TaxID=252184 RepID=A0AA40CE41_9PEZI|nr:hypothetical protein B0T17DRAFT_502674 [Bombardia bombarda]